MIRCCWCAASAAAVTTSRSSYRSRSRARTGRSPWTSSGTGWSERSDDFHYGWTLWSDQLAGTLDALGIERASCRRTLDGWCGRGGVRGAPSRRVVRLSSSTRSTRRSPAGSRCPSGPCARRSSASSRSGCSPTPARPASPPRTTSAPCRGIASAARARASCSTFATTPSAPSSRPPTRSSRRRPWSCTAPTTRTSSTPRWSARRRRSARTHRHARGRRALPAARHARRVRARGGAVPVGALTSRPVHLAPSADTHSVVAIAGVSLPW